MPVVKRIRFTIFSKEDIRQAQKDVVELKKLNEVKSRLKERGAARQAGQGGIFSSGDQVTNLPKNIVRRQEKGLLERELTSAKGKNTKGAIIRENAFDKLKADVDKNKKNTKVLEKLFVRGNPIIQGAVSAPIGTGLGFIQSFASKFIPAGIILSIITFAASMIIDSYGKGGPNDIRVKVTQDVYSRFGTERDTAIITGKTYFANAPTLRIGDGDTRFTSYTETLIDGAARSRLLNGGYSR